MKYNRRLVNYRAIMKVTLMPQPTFRFFAGLVVGTFGWNIL